MTAQLDLDPDATAAPAPHVRVAILGTGFAGLGAAIEFARRGERDFIVFEAADDLGGTWRDNTYPGCQCDVPSTLYSFSFAPKPDWSRTFPEQAEIWEYLRDCAQRFDIDTHLRLGHAVLDARWDNEARHWRIQTSHGVWTADVFVAGFGGLSAPSIPDIPGLDSFSGSAFHSARWDHGIDLTGKRVAVVGTGASAIQIVPLIQPQVAQLHLFQRTPAWVLPHRDRATTALERWAYRRLPALQRLVRGAVYWGRELLVFGMARNPRLLEPLRRMGKLHLAKQVPDPALRARLTPDFNPGCKRLLLSNGYYPAVAAANSELVTDTITEVRGSTIVTADGAEREVDVVIFATGFRVTDHPATEAIHGRDGQSMAKTWAGGGMRAYLGTTVPGFPNLFLLSGPNTGIGHTSLVFMIESQIRYLVDALRTLRRTGTSVLEVRPATVEAYAAELRRKMRNSVWTTGGCASWYLDERGENTTLWPDFTWKFRLRTRRFDAQRYRLWGPPWPTRTATSAKEAA